MVALDQVDDKDVEATIQNCIDILRQMSCKVVAFDMDQTAVAMHSRGRLRRDNLVDYMDKAVPPFVQLVPALHAAGFSLAIATHSDEAEFDSTAADITRGTHIMGNELVTALLHHHFPKDIVSAFCIVAYNPRVRGQIDSEENKIKRYHMRQLLEHFDDVDDVSHIVFFDDVPAVVQDCRDHCGVQAVQVDNPAAGLQWTDISQLLTTRVVVDPRALQGNHLPNEE